MSDFDNGKSKVGDLKNSAFVHSDGSAYLPSLLTKEEEANFEITRDFNMDGYMVKPYGSLRNTVYHIKKYELSDQYNDVFGMLSDQDLYWLKYIGRSKSVQKLQLYRQGFLYPGQLSRLSMDKAIRKLLVNGLISKWKYIHPSGNKTVDVFTLTGNGYRFLDTFFGMKEELYNPDLFYRQDPRIHIRFWQMVDLAQLLKSLPSFRNINYLFRGDPQAGLGISPSSLQVELNLFDTTVSNLVIYPMLNNDKPTFYKDITNNWSAWTNDGQELTKKVDGLGRNGNILTFYTPLNAAASYFSRELNLKVFNYPIIFIVGAEIFKNGITNAFFMPAKDRDPVDGNNLLRVPMEDLIKE